MAIVIKAMMDTSTQPYQPDKNLFFCIRQANNTNIKHQDSCVAAMVHQFVKMKKPTKWDGLNGFGKFNDRDVKRQFDRLIGLGYIRFNNGIYEFWEDPTSCPTVALI